MLAFTKCINTISRCTMQYRSNKLTDLAINGPQCTYILHICRHPGITQDALAQMIYINKSNVTRQLALLEAQGFITRTTSQVDHRLVEVFPTQKALAALPRVLEVFKDWNDYLTADLSQTEKDKFFELLEKMTNKAKNYVDTLKKE